MYSNSPVSSMSPERQLQVSVFQLGSAREMIASNVNHSDDCVPQTKNESKVSVRSCWACFPPTLCVRALASLRQASETPC